MSDKCAFSRTAVLDTRAWGTAFAQILADTELEVSMQDRNTDVVEFINSGENVSYLSGIELSERISATSNIARAAEGSQTIVVAVPVAAVRSTLESARDRPAKDTVFLSLTKGPELESLLRVDEITAQVSGTDESRVAILSGPNFSRGIVERSPTTTIIASTNLELASSLAKSCHTPYFRPYMSTDVIGSEIAGAVKNVITAMIDAVKGMDFGVDTKATLITRDLMEITHPGTTLGADPQTFTGLMRVEGLMATCSLRLSRNFSFGHRVGQGMSIEEATALSPGVVGGARSAEPIPAFAKSLNMDVPIISTAVAVVRNGVSIEQMGQMLLSRPQKMDGWRIELVQAYSFETILSAGWPCLK